MDDTAYGFTNMKDSSCSGQCNQGISAENTALKDLIKNSSSFAALKSSL